jgi:hypothetical protein
MISSTTVLATHASDAGPSPDSKHAVAAAVAAAEGKSSTQQQQSDDDDDDDDDDLDAVNFVIARTVSAESAAAAAAAAAVDTSPQSTATTPAPLPNSTATSITLPTSGDGVRRPRLVFNSVRRPGATRATSGWAGLTISPRGGTSGSSAAAAATAAATAATAAATADMRSAHVETRKAVDESKVQTVRILQSVVVQMQLMQTAAEKTRRAIMNRLQQLDKRMLTIEHSLEEAKL